MPDRPAIFVGSSTEGKAVADAIQANLVDICDLVVWNQGFSAGNTTLESLVSQLGLYDFAILVFTPDNDLDCRGTPLCPLATTCCWR